MALQLCGWIKKGTDLDVEPFLSSLEQEGDWERAAAVALFNLDIRRAIQILNKGASSGKGECCVCCFAFGSAAPCQVSFSKESYGS